MSVAEMPQMMHSIDGETNLTKNSLQQSPLLRGLLYQKIKSLREKEHPKHIYVMGVKFAHFLEIYLRVIAAAIALRIARSLPVASSGWHPHRNHTNILTI